VRRLGSSSKRRRVCAAVDPVAGEGRRWAAARRRSPREELHSRDRPSPITPRSPFARTRGWVAKVEGRADQTSIGGDLQRTLRRSRCVRSAPDCQPRPPRADELPVTVPAPRSSTTLRTRAASRGACAAGRAREPRRPRLQAGASTGQERTTMLVGSSRSTDQKPTRSARPAAGPLLARRVEAEEVALGVLEGHPGAVVAAATLDCCSPSSTLSRRAPPGSRRSAAARGRRSRDRRHGGSLRTRSREKGRCRVRGDNPRTPAGG